MRSSRSAADPLDPGRAGFAHRGLHDSGTIENSLAAFGEAMALGCGIECDLRLTADDRLLVFHDADAQRLCGDPVIIARSTLAELGRLAVGGQRIPTLDDMLELVGDRVPILLEAKIDGDIGRFGRALRDAVVGSPARCGAMSFDPRLGQWLKAHAPGVRRGLVVRNDLPRLKRWMAMRIADPEFLAVDRRALGRRWVARLRRRMPVYGWTIATPAQRHAARPAADALIWEADGRP